MFKACTFSPCKNMPEQFPLIPSDSNRLHPFAPSPSPTWHISSGNQPIIQDLHQLGMLRRCDHLHLSAWHPITNQKRSGIGKFPNVLPHIISIHIHIHCLPIWSYMVELSSCMFHRFFLYCVALWLPPGTMSHLAGVGWQNSIFPNIAGND